MPKIPTPEQLKQWAEMHAGGWSFTAISEKFGFSPDTVSKHLEKMGAKKEKVTSGVGGPIDVGAEFGAFQAKKKLDEMRDGLDAWVEAEILGLDFEGAEDSRANLEWVRDRTGKARSEGEVRELDVLATQIVDDIHPLVKKHEKELKEKRIEGERIQAEQLERERIDSIEWAKVRVVEGLALRTMSCNTISAIAGQMGLQIPEHFKTAFLARTYEEALGYVQAISLWLRAGGDPNSFLYFLQSDSQFIQSVHANYRR